MTRIPRALERSIEGVKRVSGVVHSMKEFAHPDTEDLVAFDANHGIKNTLNISRNEWKYVAEVETDLDPDLSTIMGLPGPFNQAILNIVVNAAHAIEEVTGSYPKKKPHHDSDARSSRLG